MRASPRAPRRGFTMAECGIALAVLAAVGVVVAQLATTSLAERLRSEARLEATETAANVLEAARARPWDELTPQWAAEQKLPAHLAERWLAGSLTVRVEPEPQRPYLKRVTVDVLWGGVGHGPERPVTLTALFAARAAGGGS